MGLFSGSKSKTQASSSRQASTAGADSETWFKQGNQHVSSGALGEAERWFLRAADAGHVPSMLELSDLLVRRGAFDAAAGWWEKAAESGVVVAMFNLGTRAEHLGDVTSAIHWHMRAAEGGHDRSKFRLGILYQGRGEEERAITWYTKVFAQYTNALIGVTIVLIVYIILRELDLSERTVTGVIAVAALLPNTLVLSAIFLREGIIALLIAASLLFFIRWLRGGASRHAMLAIALILAASTFHSGAITVVLGYLTTALFYRPREGKFTVGMHTVLTLLVALAIVALTVRQYPDLFLGKFEAVDSEQDLLEVANARRGASTFLTELSVTNYRELLLYSPIRAFYFLGAPLPWDFRGAGDAFTFVADSLFYLGTIIIAIRAYYRYPERRHLLFVLLLIILISTLVFGAGVSNAGTAMRHRFKLLSLFLVIGGVSYSTRDSNSLEMRGLHSDGTQSYSPNRTRSGITSLANNNE